jgi:fatty acid desaturase
MPVFAIFSSYLENKLFVTFTTNVTDDLILLLLVSGFTLIVFSREKNEVENSDNLRFLAVGKALIWNTLFLILSILFVFGSGFIVVLVVNLFSLPLLYLLFFHRLRYLALKSKKGISSHELNYDEGHQKRDN